MECLLSSCPDDPGGLRFGARETVSRVLRANVDDHRENLRAAIEETGFLKTDRAVGGFAAFQGSSRPESASGTTRDGSPGRFREAGATFLAASELDGAS
jgi:hypothetical protein